MTRKQLNQLLVIATREHEECYIAWFCGGQQTPEVLKKLSRAQEDLALVREQIRQQSKQEDLK